MTVQEIKYKLSQAGNAELPALLELYRNDSRAGVKKILEAFEKKQKALEAEYARLEAMTSYEKENRAFGVICGIDEAGRGPLAGPVAAAAVILPEDCRILYVNDSKKLSEKKREELYDEIMDQAVSVGVGIVGPGRIDEINILQATYEAMREAVSKLSAVPDVCLNDAVTIPGLPGTIRQVPIIKGDAKSLSIAAASIVAKVTRDRMMREYDRLYPEYGFAGHKGYGSADHIAAIRKHGISPIHRRTFLKNLL
ncbi:ribonuclease HII [Fusibacillus kribbianus]|uniref:Ribonuclease HII n=1 Tax=Fusibacillus kribbianus TaxID=3044208 RepID=A0AAP4B883_9FIRM|nr:ribonuclease HII [Ruminococcus sp. YH-rum2234]MDI9241741.1 ribonuclease HII [Ruminococcus sp. YH-rum2234]